MTLQQNGLGRLLVGLAGYQRTGIGTPKHNAVYQIKYSCGDQRTT